MKSKFIPDKGTLFYVEDLLHIQSPKFVEKTAGGNTVIMDRGRDRSFDGSVFRCLTRDHHVVLAKEVWSESVEYGLRRPERRMFRIDAMSFSPIGPGVARELKLDQTPDNPAIDQWDIEQ